ncbi:uncharacterized protein yc1106_04388 [Curvularia clavata]|uniref:Uncharacterized protein n=1 Tax=Curvularia clavata TaxID=95742 RepID=A0A9Q8Z6W2_CURCL|nr:uncharacterized protein yc1106_04388 [Curvularia clavata]
MAPRKPAVEGKASNTKKATAAKKSNDEVVKRGKRGYRKFGNGLLNVKPKGPEIQLVKANQQSPLLRLPPEIRNIIWGLLLGGRVLRHMFGASESFGSLRNHHLEVPLLRVCRQVYAETALIPLKQNLFSFHRETGLRTCYRMLKRHLFNHITSVQFELSITPGVNVETACTILYERMCKMLQQQFPVGLKVLTARIFSCALVDRVIEEIGVDHVRKAIEHAAPDMCVKVRVEVAGMSWGEFDPNYTRNFPSRWESLSP